MQSGYNEVGELNNIVILYPQTIRSLTIPYNPNACFDWWGYNDPALDQIYRKYLKYYCKISTQQVRTQVA